MHRSFHRIPGSSFALFVLFFIFQSCEKQSSAVIDTAVPPPTVLGATITPSTINTDTINVGSVRNPDDILDLHIVAYATATGTTGTNDVQSVLYTVTDENSLAILADGVLKNDGLVPDISSLDSTYSGSIDLQIRRTIVGRFVVTIWSEDESGNKSNAILQPLEIERLNHSPVLSGLDLDTLIALGGDDHLLLIRISATDADGQSDIQKVYFDSFRPNGSPSTGNPFLMFDDGGTVDRGGYASGDEIAGDGIYSLNVILPRTATLGTYRFEFRAVDRSLDPSNVIIRTVQVTN